MSCFASPCVDKADGFAEISTRAERGIASAGEHGHSERGVRLERGGGLGNAAHHGHAQCVMGCNRSAGVERLIVSPWTQSRDAIAAMERFAAEFVG